MPESRSNRSGRSSDLAVEAEEFLRSVLEIAVDGIVVINDEGVIRKVNPAVERLFGYSPGELIGRRINILMPSDYAAAHDLYLSKYLRTGTRHVIGNSREMVGLHKDGRTFPIDLTVSEFRIGNNRMFTGLIRDVTDRKTAELGNQRNAQAIEAGNRALLAAKRAAEIASESRGQFLAMMSHEIRTPMTAIVGFAELLTELPPGSPEGAGLRADIHRNAKYLLQLVDDVLEMSQVEFGKIDLRLVTVDLPAMLDSVIAGSGPVAERKGLRLGAEYAGPVPRHIRTDPARLQQVLCKLVANAIKFTELGEVRVLVRHCPESGTVEFEIIDTGIGMSPDEIRTVFDPFVQGDMSMTRRYGGVGLGLAISKRVTELLGGRIAVESAPRVGSRFCVSLPVGAIDSPPVTRVDPWSEFRDGPAAPPTNTITTCNLDGVEVLLAEDGFDNRRLIEFILRKAGAHLTVVENGREAVDLAQGALLGKRATDPPRPFDVILMDMQMPVLDGYAATAELRRRGYERPILALTAHSLVGDREKCMEAGCDDFASKPIDRAELVALIARHAARLRRQSTGRPQ